MEVLDEAFKGIQGTLDHMGGGTLGGGLPPSISLEGVGVSMGLLHLACCCLLRLPAPPLPNRGGRFHFRHEKGSEKGSQKAWEGWAGKPDFSQKSG